MKQTGTQRVKTTFYANLKTLSNEEKDKKAGEIFTF